MCPVCGGFVAVRRWLTGRDEHGEVFHRFEVCQYCGWYQGLHPLTPPPV